MAADDIGDARQAERALAIGYAPARSRAGLRALLALDATLAGVVRGVRTPVAGQLKLAWWREALAALDTAPAPAHPVMEAVAREVAPTVAGAELARLADGWEALLDDPVDLATHGEARGVLLFAAAARLTGAPPDQHVAAAGRGWALADLATHWNDPALAAEARAEADVAFGAAFAVRWPAPLRGLGALALLARAGLAASRPGSPRRVGRLVWHRLTGR